MQRQLGRYDLLPVGVEGFPGHVAHEVDLPDGIDMCPNVLFYTRLMAEPARSIRVKSLREQGRETDLENTTPAERLSMMWQLTLDARAFKGGALDEPRLPRHVVRLCEEGVEYLLVDAYAMAQYTLSTPTSGWPTSTR
jgi:hypothetical protein